MCVAQQQKVKIKGLKFFTVPRFMRPTWGKMRNYRKESPVRREAGLRLGPGGLL